MRVQWYSIFWVSPRSGEMSRPNFEHCPEAIQVDAVDRSKFRTCDQGSFCRRPGGDVMTPGAGHHFQIWHWWIMDRRYKKWISRPEREKALWTLLPQTRTTAVEPCNSVSLYCGSFFFIFPTHTSHILSHPLGALCQRAALAFRWSMWTRRIVQWETGKQHHCSRVLKPFVTSGEVMTES